MRNKILAFLLCLCLVIPILLPAGATGNSDVVEPELVYLDENGNRIASPLQDAADETEAATPFAEMSVAEQYVYMNSLYDTDEDAALALLDTLTQAQLEALYAYAAEQNASQAVGTQATVDFTDAAPFLPAVDITAESVLRTAANDRVDVEGLISSKKATLNKDGSYTIRMETYVTGQTITSSHTQPVDFVLVIDQSGSMASTFSTGQTYQAAMQQSINTFIKNVSSKYDATYSDHRIALVTFATSSKTLVDWTFVDNAGANKLTTAINGLSADGVTDTAGGMTQAQRLMTTRYNYNGKNTKRQKVVVLFTDGIPYTGGKAYYSSDGILTSQIDMSNANSAIQTARSLKNSNVTMYTIGIFNGANVNELYDAQGYVFADAFGGVHRKDACTGKLTEVWGFSGHLNVNRQNDFGYLETAVCNRLLNYISSNFAGATGLGVKYHHSEKPSTSKYANITGHPVARGFFFEITKNATRSKSGYYLTASNVNALNNIFSKISENISTPDVELDSETILKDIVTPYFNLPANTSEITLKVASYNRNGNWNAETAAPATVKASISGDTIEVTGFDFAKNFVSETYRSGAGYGSKLIVEFKITPKESFLGGNDVPTNGDSSGIYDKDDTLIENFERPTVNVPINTKPLVCAAQDWTIYEGGSVDAAKLYSVGSVSATDAKFVNIVPTVDGNAPGTLSPADCTDYAIQIQVTPKTDGTDSVGAANPLSGVTAFAETSTVHVLKPSVTVELTDIEKCLGETHILGEDGAVRDYSVAWFDNDHSTIPDPVDECPYTRDDLTLRYYARGFSSDMIEVPAQDVIVFVSVYLGDKELNNVSFATFCPINCHESSVRVDGTYIIHVTTGEMLIRKTGHDASIDPGQVFLFHVVGTSGKAIGIDLIVPVHGNGYARVTDLPIGNYTVTELTGWSWRYTPDSVSKNVTLTKGENRVTFANSRTENSWLDGNHSVQNIFATTH